jgi:large subunit ribosomal protein L3
MRGLIGKKLGMTQVFDYQGNRVGVTIIELGPCIVLQKKLVEGKDGYDAVVLGYGQKRTKLVNKPMLGRFKAAGVEPMAHVREFRMAREFMDEVGVGDELTAAMFQIGDFVDVVGTTIGRGFTGVMKRHNMAGARGSHGTHEYFRHGGAISTNTTPGRVFKGKRMAGQYGAERVTTQNLRVIGVDQSRNLLLVKGAVPGHANSIVYVSAALKKERQRLAKEAKAASAA